MALRRISSFEVQNNYSRKIKGQLTGTRPEDTVWSGRNCSPKSWQTW